MGMFDWFYCDLPLSVDGLKGEEFQTKDLDCDGSTYRIDKTRRLMVRTGKDEWEPANVRRRELVRFYTSRDLEKDEDGRLLSVRWIEFVASFHYGYCETLELEKDEVIHHGRAS